MLAAGSEIGQGKVLFLEPDLRTAQAAAYAAVEYIQFEGAYCQVMPSRKMKKGRFVRNLNQSRPGTWHYPPLAI